jgi:hypothetical protein
MRLFTTIRTLAIPSLLTVALTVSTALAGGGGGGGGGGTRNPFVGSWAGIPAQAGLDLFRYQFTFTKDFKFTLVEVDRATGLTTATFTGTYVLGGFGSDGFPVITMFSQGQILLQEEYSGAAEGIFLRGTIAINIGKL